MQLIDLINDGHDENEGDDRDEELKRNGGDTQLLAIDDEIEEDERDYKLKRESAACTSDLPVSCSASLPKSPC